MVIKSINQIIDIQTLFCKTKDVFDVKKSNKNEHLFNMKSTNSNSMKFLVHIFYECEYLIHVFALIITMFPQMTRLL